MEMGDSEGPKAVKEGDSQGDQAGVIIVVSNFLLGLCRAYSPTLETKVATELLQRMKSKLDVKDKYHCRVKAGSENDFAALVHASVVIFRALPKSRPLVLRHGMVGMITHCVRNCTLASVLRGGGKEAASESSPMAWQRWLAPALLLLEVMAQPTSLVNDADDEEAASKPANRKSEYGKVLAEHRKQASKLAKTARSVFAAAMGKDAGKAATPKKKKETKQGEKICPPAMPWAFLDPRDVGV